MSSYIYPQITFRVNLETRDSVSWSLPESTILDGNQTQNDSVNLKNTRSLLLPGLALNDYSGIFPNYLRHNQTFVANGKQALYLQNTYVSNPPKLNDVLQVVSIS